MGMRPPEFREVVDLGGEPVTIRAMQPADRAIEDAFVRNLSPGSRHLRFQAALKQLTPDMLDRFTNVDYPNEMALIATVAEGGTEREIGVARYVRTPRSDRAEVAVVVADDWQGRGVGTRLLVRLRDIARSQKVHRLAGPASATSGSLLRLLAQTV
jgi:acetyltransferase